MAGFSIINDLMNFFFCKCFPLSILFFFFFFFPLQDGKVTLFLIILEQFGLMVWYGLVWFGLILPSGCIVLSL